MCPTKFPAGCRSKGRRNAERPIASSPNSRSSPRAAEAAVREVKLDDVSEVFLDQLGDFMVNKLLIMVNIWLMMLNNHLDNNHLVGGWYTYPFFLSCCYAVLACGPGYAMVCTHSIVQPWSAMIVRLCSADVHELLLRVRVYLPSEK